MASKGYGGDRSRLVMGLVLSAVDHGWSFDEIFTDLMNPVNRGGAKVQEMAARSPRDAQRYVRSAYEKARRWAHLHPPTADPDSADVHAVRQAVDRLHRRADVTWKGKAGATDFAVYSVHLATAARVGRLTYTLDRRTIAETIPCADRTVTTSHRRLIFRGLLRRDAAGCGRRASAWTIVDSPEGDAESAVTFPTLLRSPLLPEGEKRMGNVTAESTRKPLTSRAMQTTHSCGRTGGDPDSVSRNGACTDTSGTTRFRSGSSRRLSASAIAPSAITCMLLNVPASPSESGAAVGVAASRARRPSRSNAARMEPPLTAET